MLRVDSTPPDKVDDLGLLGPSISKDLRVSGTETVTEMPLHQFIEDERRAHGGVSLSVYWAYVRAGKLK